VNVPEKVQPFDVIEPPCCAFANCVKARDPDAVVETKKAAPTAAGSQDPFGSGTNRQIPETLRSALNEQR
jgi:hypothetical protein